MKTVRQKLNELHKFVTLTTNVIFVSGVAFLTTLLRLIRLFTIEHDPSHTAKQLSSSLNEMVHLHARGGFTIHIILMDMKFEKVKDKLGKVQVNAMTAHEHVGEIKDGNVPSRRDLRVSCLISLSNSYTN